MVCTHGHPVRGAVVPGLLPIAAPGVVLGVPALFLFGACDEFLRRLGLSLTPGSCEKGVFTK
jgi:hypothetical protein